MGRALRGRHGQVVLTMKVRWPTGTGPNDAGLSRYHIQQSVEVSLRRLQTDTIDVLYLHGWDALTPLEESLRAFDDLVVVGKVRYIGVSNFKAWQVMKALGLSDQHGWGRASSRPSINIAWWCGISKVSFSTCVPVKVWVWCPGVCLAADF